MEQGFLTARKRILDLGQSQKADICGSRHFGDAPFEFESRHRILIRHSPLDTYATEYYEVSHQSLALA